MPEPECISATPSNILPRPSLAVLQNPFGLRGIRRAYLASAAMRLPLTTRQELNILVYILVRCLYADSRHVFSTDGLE